MTMLSAKGLLAGLAATGLVGCSVASGSHAANSPTAHRVRYQPSAVRAELAGRDPQASARTAAARFHHLYFSGSFAASWSLLTSTARNEISKNVWVRVHSACPPAQAGQAAVVSAVTVFGNAAIVTETVHGRKLAHRQVEDVFNYSNGRWGFSPEQMSIYQHGSVASDVAAVKAAGLCRSLRIF